MTAPQKNGGNGFRLSIILPAYNEEKRIGKTMERVVRCVKGLAFPSEVIVVDDGSEDETRNIVNGFIRQEPSVHLRLIPGQHRGKGAAIRAGVLASGGDCILFTDADLSTPLDLIDAFIERIGSGRADVVIASREVAGARRYREPMTRKIASRIFNLVVRTFTVKGLRDTQCGFKAFRADVAREIFGKTVIDRFGFDVELLYLAQKKRLSIEEYPVQWYYGPSSTMKVWRDGCLMFLDVVRIRINDILGRYSDGPSPSHPSPTVR